MTCAIELAAAYAAFCLFIIWHFVFQTEECRPGWCGRAGRFEPVAGKHDALLVSCSLALGLVTAVDNTMLVSSSLPLLSPYLLSVSPFTQGSSRVQEFKFEFGDRVELEFEFEFEFRNSHELELLRTRTRETHIKIVENSNSNELETR